MCVTRQAWESKLRNESDKSIKRWSEFELTHKKPDLITKKRQRRHNRTADPLFIVSQLKLLCFTTLTACLHSPYSQDFMFELLWILMPQYLILQSGNWVCGHAICVWFTWVRDVRPGECGSVGWLVLAGFERWSHQTEPRLDIPSPTH